MRKRVRIAIAVLLVALISVSVWQVSQPREPVYQGKPLSSWLKGYRINESIPVEAWKRQGQEADEAVRQLGSAALPSLLRMLRAKDSALKTKLMDAAERQHVIEINWTPAEEWNHRARRAFEVLGTNAQTAVPALLEIATQNISRTSQCYAIEALGFIGPPAEDAVPVLLRWATNSDWELRDDALFALGKIRAEPDRVLPVLIAAVHDPARALRGRAIWALEDFGAGAKPAVPALLEILKSQDDFMDESLAAAALKAIDPEAAAKAGVK